MIFFQLLINKHTLTLTIQSFLILFHLSLSPSLSLSPGADPGFAFSFFWGGGGRKRFYARTHITSAEPNSLSADVQGPLFIRALEALGLC